MNGSIPRLSQRIEQHGKMQRKSQIRGHFDFDQSIFRIPQQNLNASTSLLQKTELQKIIRILSKPLKERNNMDLKMLISLTKTIAFFQQYEDTPFVHESCCAHMSYEFYAEDTTIFKIDSVGDRFYIILEGEVGVYIRSESDTGNAKDTTYCVKSLEKGCSFGELALLYETPRMATITAHSDTHVAVLQKKEFLRVLKNSAKEKLNQKLLYLTQLSFLEKMSQSLLREIYSHAFYLTTYKDQYIYKQGDSTDHFFIVRNGEFSVQKCSIDEISPSRRQSQDKLPLASRIAKKGKPFQIQLSLLVEHDYFGEEDLMRGNSTRSFSVQCTTVQGELIMVQKNLFFAMLENSHTRQFLEAHLATKEQSFLDRILNTQNQMKKFKGLMVDQSSQLQNNRSQTPPSAINHKTNILNHRYQHRLFKESEQFSPLVKQNTKIGHSHYAKSQELFTGINHTIMIDIQSSKNLENKIYQLIQDKRGRETMSNRKPPLPSVDEIKLHNQQISSRYSNTTTRKRKQKSCFDGISLNQSQNNFQTQREIQLPSNQNLNNLSPQMFLNRSQPKFTSSFSKNGLISLSSIKQLFLRSPNQNDKADAINSEQFDDSTSISKKVPVMCSESNLDLLPTTCTSLRKIQLSYQESYSNQNPQSNSLQNDNEQSLEERESFSQKLRKIRNESAHIFKSQQETSAVFLPKHFESDEYKQKIASKCQIISPQERFVHEIYNRCQNKFIKAKLKSKNGNSFALNSSCGGRLPIVENALNQKESLNTIQDKFNSQKQKLFQNSLLQFKKNNSNLSQSVLDIKGVNPNQIENENAENSNLIISKTGTSKCVQFFEETPKKIPKTLLHFSGSREKSSPAFVRNRSTQKLEENKIEDAIQSQPLIASKSIKSTEFLRMDKNNKIKKGRAFNQKEEKPGEYCRKEQQSFINGSPSNSSIRQESENSESQLQIKNESNNYLSRTKSMFSYQQELNYQP